MDLTFVYWLHAHLATEECIIYLGWRWQVVRQCKLPNITVCDQLLPASVRCRCSSHVVIYHDLALQDLDAGHSWTVFLFVCFRFFFSVFLFRLHSWIGSVVAPWHVDMLRAFCAFCVMWHALFSLPVSCFRGPTRWSHAHHQASLRFHQCALSQTKFWLILFGNA